jgi:hypothetical protein
LNKYFYKQYIQRMMIELLTHLHNIETSLTKFRKHWIERKKRFQKICSTFNNNKEEYYETNIDSGIILTEELIEIYLLILENFKFLTDPFNTIITLQDLKQMMSITNKHTKHYILLIMPLEQPQRQSDINQTLLKDGLSILLDLKDALDKKYIRHLNEVEPNNLQNYYLNDISENKYHNMIYVEELILQ